MYASPAMLLDPKSKVMGMRFVEVSCSLGDISISFFVNVICIAGIIQLIDGF